MRIQTRGNSNTVWLSSDEGVINGTMTLSVTPLEKILQAVNEKYGTSFESWSQLPTAYEVGDTVPNWNAYEKIELPEEKVIISDGKYYLISLDFNNPQSNYMLGIAYEDGDYFTLEPSQDGNQLVLYDKEGVRVGSEAPDWNTLIDNIHNSIMSYNGQSVWIERDSTTPLNPNTWERIP